MKFGVVWRLAQKNTQDAIVMASAEAIREADTPEDAKVEGRTLMEEIADIEGSDIMPLAVVEMSEHMLAELDKCPMLTVPENPSEEDTEVTLHNIEDLGYWKSNDWWPS